MTIKAIETRYNGYHFRSRLEARWAVFFDTAGINYQYEPEGFDLGESGWYLPDFWLPEQQYWIEIKGPPPTLNEKSKIVGLHDLTGKESFLIHGDPWFWEQGKRDIYMSITALGWWNECSLCGKIFIKCFNDGWNYCREHSEMCGSLFRGLNRLQSDIVAAQLRYRKGNMDIEKPSFEFSFKLISLLTHYNIDGTNLDNCHHGIILSPKRQDWSSKLENAYRAARSARFEHGETP